MTLPLSAPPFRPGNGLPLLIILAVVGLVLFAVQ